MTDEDELTDWLALTVPLSDVAAEALHIWWRGSLRYRGSRTTSAGAWGPELEELAAAQLIAVHPGSSHIWCEVTLTDAGRRYCGARYE